MTSADTTMMNNFNANNQNANELSEIQSFYKDTTVFLTGATGLMGNLILEKLIRTCSGVKRIYILIRDKKGKTTEERFKELFDDPVFAVMKKEIPDYLEKISAVVGDCLLPNLGIGEQYREILKNEVNIIIHSAATVRFDEHLRKAVSINIVALQDLLKLGQEIKNLKSFIHISTAYSNCAGRKVVDEIFYKPPISGNKLSNLVDSLDDDYITRITPSLLREWPNTYAMTKAIAEGELLTHGKGLPVGIVRPSMIVATYNEPITGWINNIYGPTGIVTATGLGIMRCMCAGPKEVADIIPGDYVSNCVLASAWDTRKQWEEYNNAKSITGSNRTEKEAFTPPIYNIVSSNGNRLNWGTFSSYNKRYGRKIPSVKAIWPILLRLTSNKYEYLILWFLLHTIPAYIVDFLAKLTGRTPQLVNGYRKLYKFSDVIAYFSLKSWTFRDHNTRSLIGRLSKLDQSLFPFDITKLEWDDYFQKHVRGIRIYIAKDPMETLPQALKRAKKLKMAYHSLLVILGASFLLLIYGLFKLFS